MSNIFYNCVSSLISLTAKYLVNTTSLLILKTHGDPIANDCVAAFKIRIVVESQMLDNFAVALIQDQLSKC